MQVMMRSIRRFYIGAVVAMTLCGTGAAADAPMRVEVWHRGDDALSQTLFLALEDAFNSSPDFVLTGVRERTVGTLIVTIPDHVESRRRRWQTRIIYRVEFRTATLPYTDLLSLHKGNQLIGLSRGSCWKGSVKKCVKNILKDAKAAATKVPRGKIEDQTGDRKVGEDAPTRPARK